MFRMHPSFFVAGAQKCGTTSLFNYLIMHPCVLRPAKKEIHFFSDNYDKGMRWYLNHYPSRLKQCLQAISLRQQIVTGEATPYYVFHPHAPARIKKHFPDARIIIMLRDPVERAYSHYKYHVKLGVEDLSFEQAIEKEGERLQGEYQKMLNNEHYNSVNYKEYSYLKRGVYVEQIKRWFELFEKESIRIFRSEDFFSDPGVVYQNVLEFLGLSSYPLKTYKRFNAGKDSELSREAKEYLQEYYKPYNRQLNELTGIDFQWR
ncbi:MAG: sulfotransferase [Gammaproteobacteria bacterium]